MSQTSTQQSQGETKMPTIQLLRSGQITLPNKLRSTLNLHPGDLLDAEVKEKRIILTPVTTVPKTKEEEQEEAKERMFKLIEKNWERNKDLDPDEVQKIVDQAVKEVRQGNFK